MSSNNLFSSKECLLANPSDVIFTPKNIKVKKNHLPIRTFDLKLTGSWTITQKPSAYFSARKHYLHFAKPKLAILCIYCHSLAINNQHRRFFHTSSLEWVLKQLSCNVLLRGESLMLYWVFHSLSVFFLLN